jgi:TPP-dependent pyruvate/acetoin dehydrogenase alpha subunit
MSTSIGTAGKLDVPTMVAQLVAAERAQPEARIARVERQVNAQVSAIGLLRGMPPATVLSWWRGHPAGLWNPEDYRVASICVPIGTHVPHAAGLAWGKKLSNGVVLELMGGTPEDLPWRYRTASPMEMLP